MQIDFFSIGVVLILGIIGGYLIFKHKQQREYVLLNKQIYHLLFEEYMRFVRYHDKLYDIEKTKEIIFTSHERFFQKKEFTLTATRRFLSSLQKEYAYIKTLFPQNT